MPVGAVVDRLGVLAEPGRRATEGRILALQGEHHLVAHAEGAIEADAHLLLIAGSRSHQLPHLGRDHRGVGPIGPGGGQVEGEAVRGALAGELQDADGAVGGTHGQVSVCSAREIGHQLGQQPGADPVQGLSTAGERLAGIGEVLGAHHVADLGGSRGTVFAEGDGQSITGDEVAGEGHPLHLVDLGQGGFLRHHRPGGQSIGAHASPQVDCALHGGFDGVGHGGVHAGAASAVGQARITGYGHGRRQGIHG